MGFFKTALDVGTLGATSSGGRDFLFGSKGPGNQWLKLDPSTADLSNRIQQGQKRIASGLAHDIAQTQKIIPDAPSLAAAIEAGQLRSLKGQAEDARRRAEDLVAKRRVGDSSVGLGLIARADEPYRKQMADVRANRPLTLQQALSDRIGMWGRAAGVGGALAGAPVQQDAFMPGSTGRSGGLMASLLPAAGTALGAYLGGPMGAQAGGQVGGAFSKSMTQNSYQAPQNPFRFQQPRTAIA